MKDKCVICGKETEYEKDTPVSARYGYVEGAGQLCRDDYNRIYNTVDHMVRVFRLCSMFG